MDEISEAVLKVSPQWIVKGLDCLKWYGVLPTRHAANSPLAIVGGGPCGNHGCYRPSRTRLENLGGYLRFD